MSGSALRRGIQAIEDRRNLENTASAAELKVRDFFAPNGRAHTLLKPTRRAEAMG